MLEVAECLTVEEPIAGSRLLSNVLGGTRIGLDRRTKAKAQNEPNRGKTSSRYAGNSSSASFKNARHWTYSNSRVKQNLKPRKLNYELERLQNIYVLPLRLSAQARTLKLMERTQTSIGRTTADKQVRAEANAS